MLLADITSQDKMILERAFDMQSGYVLDFSNRTFQEFISEITGYDIYNDKYAFNGESKANRLRSFWKVESNYINSLLINGLLDRMITLNTIDNIYVSKTDEKIITECRNIAARLSKNVDEEDLHAIRPIGNQREFDILARSVRESIKSNEPESAIDRLHTYFVKYIRTRCKKNGIIVDTLKPVQSLLGEYIKCIKSKGQIRTSIIERVLKSSISIIESFNDIRNQSSLAHDNQILDNAEAMFVFKSISNIIQFIDEVDPL